MIVWSLFIISHMGLFVYTQKGSIISMVDLPTTEIIEPKKTRLVTLSLLLLFDGCAYRLMSSSGRAMVSFPLRSTTRTDGG